MGTDNTPDHCTEPVVHCHDELQTLRQRYARLRREHDDLLRLMQQGQTTRIPAWLPSVVEHSPTLVLVTDLEGTVEYANPMFCDISGFSTDEVVGQSVFTHTSKMLPPAERDRMMRALIHGREWRGLLRQCKKDGDCYWLDAVIRRHDNPDGTANLVGIMEDVTERLNTRSEGLSNERRLGLLYRIANVVNVSPSLDELFPTIHRILLEYIAAPNFYIALIDKDNDRLVFPYYMDEMESFLEIRGISDPATKSLTLDVIRSGTPLLINAQDVDAGGDGLREGVSGVVGTMSAVWLGVPLMVSGTIIGAMAIQDYHNPHQYTEQDADLLAAISGQVALSIERIRMEDALRCSEKRYRTVSDSAFGLETWCSPGGRMLYVSTSCLRLTGYAEEDFLADPQFMLGLLHRDDVPIWTQFMETDEHSDTDSIDVRFFRKDGRMRWLNVVCRSVFDDDGSPLGVRCSMRDITDRKSLERRLSYESLHDTLTGLANRELCLDRIRQVLARSKRRPDYHYAVVFLDIDRFRVINDSLGHAFGDSVLRETGLRLLHCVRSLDTVCRFGGDQFILLLDELESPREAITAVHRVREALAKPLTIGDRSIRLTASFGIVLSQSGCTQPEEILQNANIALYEARREDRRNHIKVFTTRMRERAARTMFFENDLRRAIQNKEFYVLYQPILSIKTGEVVGFEALCRWRHPIHGEILPSDFIPHAEDTGDIIDLGLLVLRQACATMAEWQAAYPSRADLVLSVNLSAVQFSQPSLVDQITCILDETGLTPSCLKLEITETAIMRNAESALVMLKRLKALGIQLSIDDFGTGYCSLSYLLQFPVNTLKVDRSFIVDMSKGSQNTEIVRIVLALARTIGLDVVAEGVEQADQLDLLKGLSCDFVQGFYFSRPLESTAAKALIAGARTS